MDSTPERVARPLAPLGKLHWNFPSYHLSNSAGQGAFALQQLTQGRPNSASGVLGFPTAGRQRWVPRSSKKDGRGHLNPHHF